jgi:hypothetical protein
VAREFGFELPPSVPESLVVIALGSISTIFVLIRLISIPDSIPPPAGRGIGIWISLLASLAVIAAGFATSLRRAVATSTPSAAPPSTSSGPSDAHVDARPRDERGEHERRHGQPRRGPGVITVAQAKAVVEWPDGKAPVCGVGTSGGGLGIDERWARSADPLTQEGARARLP